MGDSPLVQGQRASSTRARVMHSCDYRGLAIVTWGLAPYLAVWGGGLALGINFDVLLDFLFLN